MVFFVIKWYIVTADHSIWSRHYESDQNSDNS